jgi:hypothetical protein
MYPTFTFQHVGVDALILLVCHIISTLLLGNKLSVLPKKFLDINQKIIFPLTLIMSVAFIVIEQFHYPNFIYSSFHINPFAFFYLPILSATIVLIPRLKTDGFGYFLYIPLFFLLAMFVCSLYFPKQFLVLIHEDSYLENLQFFGYVISALLSLAAALRLQKNKHHKNLAYIFFFLGLGLFFIAGEEISWGQRLFGIATPEDIKEINVQGEITVHNLNIFQYSLPFVYMLAGIYGLFSRYIVENFLKGLKKYILLTPPYIFGPLCLLFFVFYYLHMFGLYTFANVVDPLDTIFPNNWNEVIETCIVMVLCGYLYYIFKVANNKTRT